MHTRDVLNVNKRVTLFIAMAADLTPDMTDAPMYTHQYLLSIDNTISKLLPVLVLAMPINQLMARPSNKTVD